MAQVQKSVISKETIEQVLPNYTIKKCDQHTFHTASGDELTSMGSVQLAFTIEDVLCEIEAHVFAKLSQSVLLGQNWMEKYEAQLKFTKRKVTFNVKAEIASVSEIAPGEMCIKLSHPLHCND